eukprot:140787-Pyramimonas_sp.AAC.1
MLLPQAQSQWESDPSLWLRGVPGRNLTTPTFLDPLVAPPPTYRGDADLRSFCVLPGQEPLHVFGDGSGGRYSSDPRRRRCGSAIAVLQG